MSRSSGGCDGDPSGWWPEKEFLALPLAAQRQVAATILAHLNLSAEPIDASLERNSHDLAELVRRFSTMSRGYYLKMCRSWVIDGLEARNDEGRHDEAMRQVKQMSEANYSDGAYDAARASIEACLRVNAGLLVELKRFHPLGLEVKRWIVRTILEHLRFPADVTRLVPQVGAPVHPAVVRAAPRSSLRPLSPPV